MNRHAIVTGASSGIGKEFARILGREGFDLTVIARTESRLQILANEIQSSHPGCKVTVRPCDLSNDLQREQLIKDLDLDNNSYDLLVNNAGFGHYGPLRETDWSRLHEMINLNIVSLTHLTHAFCGSLQKKHKTHILNVASTAAFQAGPLMAVYYATKAYVLSLGVALSSELKHDNIVVSTLCPGPTETEFVNHSGVDKSKLLQHMRFADPRQVAEFGYRALKKEKTIAIPGVMNKILAQSNRMISRSLAANLAKKFQEPI